MGSTGTAKALAVVLAVGAVLMAFVAFGIGMGKPFRIDDSGDLAVAFVVLGAWLAVYLLVGGLAVADAVRLSRRRDLGALQESANLAKLGAVPFFVLNFVALAETAAVVGAGDSDRLGLAGILLGLLFMVLTYVVMLPTSAYGVAILVLLRKDDRIGRAFFGINLAMHFLFVVDVVSMILVVEVARHILGTSRPPGAFARNLLTVVLAVGSAVALIWLAFVAMLYLVDYHSFDDPGDIVAEGTYWLSFGASLEFVLLVVAPVVPLIAFRTAVRWFLLDDLEALRRSARTVKLVMIPLFVQNFVLCAVVVFAVTLIPVAITRGAILLMGPAGVAFVGTLTAAALVPALIGTYLMLLPTSIYSITYLSLLLRRRSITPGRFAVHAILQLLFVTDIISTLITTRRPTPTHQLAPAVTTGRTRSRT
ncbi:MAG TPA: DUF6652 family protein [Kribbella sp.]|nr:DUF6652 family protein [Kribbella sp.]